MVEYSVTLTEDINRLNALRPRGFKTRLKQSMIDGVLFWHDQYAPLHFEMIARRRYPEAYARDRRRGRPLYRTGTLRSRILASKMRNDVSGTADRGVRLKMLMGRPPQFTEETLKAAVFILMRTEKISFRQAQRRVFSRAGYSKLAKLAFLQRIPAVNPQETKRLGQVLHDNLVHRINEPGPRTRRTIA